MPEQSLASAPDETMPAPRARLPRAPGFAVDGSGPTALISVVTIAALLLAWAWVTEREWVKPLFLPTPASVWRQFADYATGRANDQSLAVHLGASTARVGIAFLLACLTGIPLGIAMGVSRWVRGIADPVLEFYRPLPPLAYLPLIIIWCGIGELPKVLLIYLSCLAPLALAARSGVRSAAIEQVHAAASMGATRAQLIRFVLLPAALPEILVGMRIAVGFGWTTLVAAEMVAASRGMGQLVLNASNFLRTDIVVMGILVIGAVACLMDLAMRRLEMRLVPWKGRAS